MGEGNEPDAGSEVIGETRGDVDREACLPHPARTSERDQPDVRLEKQPAESNNVFISPEQRGQWG